MAGVADAAADDYKAPGYQAPTRPDDYRVVFTIAHKYFRGYTNYINVYVSNIRRIYPSALIIIVDNNSTYKDENLGQFNGMEQVIVLDNTLESKFEMGAYQVAMRFIVDNSLTVDYQYFVFTQDTFLLYQKYDFASKWTATNTKAAPINSYYQDGHYIEQSRAVLEPLGLYNRMNEVTFCWCNSFAVRADRIEQLLRYVATIVTKTNVDRMATERYFTRIIYELNDHVNTDIDGDIRVLPYNCHEVNYTKPGMKTHFIKYAQQKTEATADKPRVNGAMIGDIGISLGWRCQASQIAINKGLRRLKSDGYRTCPFDIMVSNYIGVCKCIADDFKYFCDPQYLVLRTAPAMKPILGDNQVDDELWIYNTYYGFAFNHESPGHGGLYQTENWPGGINHYVDNQFAKFIERYTDRINNFRYYIANASKINFVILRYAAQPADLAELRRVLTLTHPNLTYEIHVTTEHLDESVQMCLDKTPAGVSRFDTVYLEYLGITPESNPEEHARYQSSRQRAE